MILVVLGIEKKAESAENIELRKSVFVEILFIQQDNTKKENSKFKINNLLFKKSKSHQKTKFQQKI